MLFVKAFHILRPDVLDYPLAFEVCITPWPPINSNVRLTWRDMQTVYVN